MSIETVHITDGTEMPFTTFFLQINSHLQELLQHTGGKKLKLQLGQVNYCMKFFCVAVECCGVGTTYA